ncbi:splicing factor 3b subunit 3 [Phtheirospermum japonicum]|uniref:Splicing factor 3b subunit 3 n=1 Tax=Phtheirospermum japonicum TaxID=374723 RepID=A0A830BNT2_9LAMI|nr:splicing factor 3b subunit 3 [Phtheirospermum japonicum]
MVYLSSRPWLSYVHQGHFQLTLLSYEPLEYAASFSSDQCAEGVVAVAGDVLRVFSIERLGESFKEIAIPLRYTLREFVLQPNRKLLVIFESGQGAFTAEEQIIRGWIYRFKEDKKVLELLHKTQFEGVPLALSQFQGRLLAGVGPVLRLYDLGKRRLLRMCETKSFPNAITSVHTYHVRIYVGNMQEIYLFLYVNVNIAYISHAGDENELYISADDTIPRWLTAAQHIDFDTMAGADKFGNICFVRLPQDVSDEGEEDPTEGISGSGRRRVHCLLYSDGEFGYFLPFSSRGDVDFFAHLEMHMRQEHPPFCGRDHIAYRSAYVPVKEMPADIACLDIAPVPEGRQRSRFLAILSLTSVSSPQESLLFLEVRGFLGGEDIASLQNESGGFGDWKAFGCSLSVLETQSAEAVFCYCERTASYALLVESTLAWLYTPRTLLTLTLLTYEALEYTASFSSDSVQRFKEDGKVSLLCFRSFKEGC